jgi:nicotinate-nucleotide pyrophosphorylase (carboxylating)
VRDPLEFPFKEAEAALRQALEEDRGSGDVTTEALVPADAGATAEFVAREAGVLAGFPVAALALEAVDRRVEVVAAMREGESFTAGAVLGRARGPARAILTAERVALNFLQRLCGIATLARRFADAVSGTGARVYDTRKTTPGLRALEKYAVRVGGGANHRMGLFDQALVKDNHLAVLAARAGRPVAEVGLGEAVAALRARRPGIFVEVEVASLEALPRALEAAPDAILLDNMAPELLARAVARVREVTGRERPLLEASGGVKLETVRAIAETGVDRISAGALTHSARAIDISLEIVPDGGR